MKKNNQIFLFFATILILGLSFRIFVILTRNIFLDEFLYTNIARSRSIKNIIFINHGIKDHGVVYYLFLKPFLLLTKDIIYLRFTNLIFYTILSIYIFATFYKLLSNKYLAIIPIFFFSIFRHFIYLNSHISPFNSALFFGGLSILALINIVFATNLAYKITFHHFIFVLSTILGFYSDYSFFYMFGFYLFFLVFVFLKKKGWLIIILNLYLFVLVFIIPGIFQFFNNLPQIDYLFNITYGSFFDLKFAEYISLIAQILILRLNSRIALFFLGLILFFSIFIPLIIKTKNNFFVYLCPFLSFSFIVNLFIIYFISKIMFYLFIERSFWFFYLIIIFLISFQIIAFFYNKKILGWVFFVTILIVNLLNIKYPTLNFSDIAFELNYNSLINKLIKETKKQKIIIVDKKHAFRILADYYFSTEYPQSGNYYKELERLRNKLKPERFTSLEEIKGINFYNEKGLILIFFNPTSAEINQIKNLKNKNRDLIIYYTQNINPIYKDFFKL